MDPIAVVLVSASPENRSSFGAVVAETADITLVETVASAADLPEILAAKQSVDVVVVDDDLGGQSALDVIRDLGRAAPLVACVLLADPETSLTAAVMAGARGVVRSPLSLQDMQGQLEAAATWSRSLRQAVGGAAVSLGAGRGSVIAVSGAKGGVGASVLATMMATEGARAGLATCLIDLDLRGGNLDFLAAVTPRRSVADLVELVGDLTIRGIREVAIETPAGFLLLGAPGQVEQAEDVAGPAVRQIVNELRRHFALIVIDAGSDLDDARAVALETADEVCLVMGCDLLSIRAGRRMLDNWDRLNIRDSAGVQLVVNRVTKKAEIQPELVAKLVKLPLALALPDVTEELEGPVNTGSLTSERPAALRRAAAVLLTRCGIEGFEANANAGGRKGRQRAASTQTAEAGQSAIELPVFVFVFLVAFFVCVQGVVVGLGHMVAGDAAAQAARAASVLTLPAEQGKVIQAANDAMMFNFTAKTTVNASAHKVRVDVSVPKIFGWLPAGLDQATAEAGYVSEVAP